jgi:CO/xanthine dehydrogenase Mo-binding subunit
MIGKSVSRLEDAPMLVGAGQFVDDILLPGTLHAGFLRSSHGHAVIKRFDADIAKSMAGVVAVYRFADIKPFLSEERLVVALPSKAFRQQVDRPVLAIDEVVYVGEPIAVHRRESAAGGRCARLGRDRVRAFGGRRRLCCGSVAGLSAKRRTMWWRNWT